MRLSGSAQIRRVYSHKARANAGPLLVYGSPNELGHSRIGLAVPRRVGTATLRNTIKRRLREAFRLAQHDWPSDRPGYDVVINVRPHEPLTPCEYQQALRSAVQALHTSWSKKSAKRTASHGDRPKSRPNH